MEKRNDNRILFIYKKKNTFVTQDLEILKEEFQVREFAFFPFNSLLNIAFNFTKQLLFLTLNGWKFKRIFIWFADYHAFLPVLFAKLFRKHSYVIIGGFDVNSSNEINYGAVKHPLRAKLVKFVLSNATCCIPVTKELEPAILKISANALIKTIPTGYESDKWHMNTGERKYFAITVSITNDKQRFLVKGIDRFIQLAHAMPDKSFLMVGSSKEYLSSLMNLPPNLDILGPVNPTKLNELYQNAEFYAQFSRSEGLPNAICEAMLCGCIPVATNVGGVANLVQNNGILLQQWDLEQAINALKKEHFSNEDREKNREFIITNYSIKKRLQDLILIMK